MALRNVSGGRAGCPVAWLGIVLAIVAVGTTVRAYAQGGPVVFVTNYLERGSFLTQPRPDQVKDTIHVFAAPGEYEPATFSIRSETTLNGIQVALTDDLKGDTGQTIPKSAVEIRLVDLIEKWRDIKLRYYLLKTATVDIPAKTTRRFWVTVHVPNNAKPGLYRSKIAIGKTMATPGPDLERFETLRTLTYEVRVLPIKLATAQETGMAYFMYSNTATCYNWITVPLRYHWITAPPVETEKRVLTEADQTRIFEDLREHGMTTVTLHLCPVVNGKFTLTGHDKNRLGVIATMETLKKAKLVAPHLPVIWESAENYGPDVWRGVLDEGRKRNWPELVFYAVDEPGWVGRQERVRAFMRKFNAFRSKYPQYGLRVTTAIGSSFGIQTVGHYYDIWIACMAQRIGESGVIADAKMQNKELWFYDCMLAAIDAETDRYYFGIWAWVSGVKGCSHYTYFDCGPRKSYVYPTKEDLIPSIGWEAVREGIDDYRYLTTLKRLADKARTVGKPELAAGADQIFADVEQMVTMDNYGKAYHKAKAAEENGIEAATSYQRPRVEPDLPIEAYDRMRLRAAGEIEKLSRALSNL